MKKMRWGVISTANIAKQFLIPAMHAAENAEVVAVASRDRQRGEAFARETGIPRVHDSYEALLADAEVDAVYNPLPNHLHVPLSVQAVEAGKHVLCEKPIAMRADQIDALIEARDRTGLFATEAYMIVHHPQWQLVRRLIDEGAIGAVRHVDTVQTFDVGADATNIRNRPETGGGSISDVGVYTYGSVRFAARAEPVELSSRIRRENGVDVWAHVVGAMAHDGGEFTFASTTSTRLPNRQEAVFQGEDGLIRVTVPCNAGVVGEAQVHLVRGDVTLVERFPTVRQYVLQAQNFVATVREGAAYPWSLEDAKGTQAMIDMVLANEM